MELYKYYGKRVKIKLKDGEIFTGNVDFYESEADSDNGIESIAITTSEGDSWGFYENEIQLIKEF